MLDFILEKMIPSDNIFITTGFSFARKDFLLLYIIVGSNWLHNLLGFNLTFVTVYIFKNTQFYQPDL